MRTQKYKRENNNSNMNYMGLPNTSSRHIRKRKIKMNIESI